MQWAVCLHRTKMVELLRCWCLEDCIALWLSTVYSYIARSYWSHSNTGEGGQVAQVSIGTKCKNLGCQTVSLSVNVVVCAEEALLSLCVSCTGVCRTCEWAVRLCVPQWCSYFPWWVGLCCVVLLVLPAYILLTWLPFCIASATGTGHAVSRGPVTSMSSCVKKVVPKANTDGLVQW